MAWRFHGRAEVSPTNPRAQGVCDRCGLWYNLDELRWQYDWRGSQLQNLRIRVCTRTCYDKPFNFFRPIILPPDPVPVRDPRLEAFTADDNWLGFTYWMLTPESAPPTTKAAVLAAVATLSGIATPVTTDRSGTITAVNQAQQVMAANGARTWLLLYNPSPWPMAVSLDTASLASTLTAAPDGIFLGEGAALFWATAQGGQAVTTSALTIVGTKAGSSFFAWEA